MAVNTTAIIGDVFLPDGTVREKSYVIFEQTGFDTDNVDDAVIVTFPIRAAIAEDGSIDVDLWPNPDGVRTTFYRVTFEIYNGTAKHLVDGGKISVPASGGPYALNDLLPIAPPASATVEDYIAYLAAAVASAEAAAADANAAVIDIVAAEAAADSAEASADAAEIDRLASETARVGAEAARDLAETYAGVDYRVASWSDLAAISGTAGEVGYVDPSDEGTHTDPVAGGTVDNSGVYEWAATGLGSAQAERIGDTGLVGVLRGSALSGGDYEVALTGSDGFLVAAFGRETSDIGPVSITADARDRLAVVGSDGFLFGEIAYVEDTEAGSEADVSTTLYLGRNLYGVEGEIFNLFANGMLGNRSNVEKVRINMQTGSGYSVTDTSQLPYDADKLGNTAIIQSRDVLDDGGNFSELIVDCYSAPKTPVTGGSPTVISIGDSITYRSGTAWAAWYLEDWGYTPSFVGTLLSLDETLDGDYAARQDDEGRPGHTLQDMTYDVTTRVSPVASGDEATYLALDTENRRLKNPFLRLSTGGDSAADIYNGYVVDFAYYVSRFSFAAPDVLWHGYGTNDIRDVPYDELEDKIYELDSLIYRRWHLDYPTKPVVRFLPNTNWETARNEVWNSGYIPTIRGMMRAANEATGPVLLVPSWAMQSAEGEYNLEHTPSPDSVTGETVRTLEDLHPTGPTRRSLFKAVAAGLACASTNNYGA